MIRLDDEHLLMIEPDGVGGAPIVDELTRRMTAAFRLSMNSPPDAWNAGWHSCTCGARSDSRDYAVFVGGMNGKHLRTNSLCVHYVAMHRDEIPASEMEKLIRLSFAEAEPEGALLGTWEGCFAPRVA
jgi:hypothetical protein